MTFFYKRVTHFNINVSNECFRRIHRDAALILDTNDSRWLSAVRSLRVAGDFTVEI